MSTLIRSISHLLVLVMLLAVTACRDDDAPPRDAGGLDKVLLDAAPAGFTPERKATGPLDLEASSIAIAYANPASTRDVLGETGFTAGMARVWTRGDEFVSAYAYQLSRPFGAQELVDYAVQALRGQPSANIFPVEGITSAHGYVLSGAAREGGQTLFCQGVWFARADVAFNHNSCSTTRPRDAEVVLNLARDQAAAVEETG